MNIFTKIRIPKLGRNNFDLSYENKLTCQMGQLIPITCQEIVPGDQFKMQSNILVRFNPLLAPMMHRVDVYTHYFFVPCRLVWDEFEEFITGGDDGLSLPVKPHTTWRQIFRNIGAEGGANNFARYNEIGPGSLLDYIGLNLGLTKEELDSQKGLYGSLEYLWLDKPIDVLPLRAYQLIYNEYYRNQNTQPENEFYKGSGLLNNGKGIDSLEPLIKLQYRNWSLDYFTSSLPFSQRGPEQTIPIDNFKINFTPGRQRVVNMDGDSAATNILDSQDTGILQANIKNPSTGQYTERARVAIDPQDTLSVSNETNISIRDLRRAERIQEWLERSARSGARYIEQIKGHFGVYSSDTRLQRPEYLGGGKQVVQISAVDQTSATQNDGTTPLGYMAGKAISGGSTNGFKTKEFEEHGFIIGIMSVLPKGGYHQGLSRKFTRFDKLDYFWPEFQNIGDQQINTSEIYFAQRFNDDNPDTGFGYTPRYAEYKCNMDEVHGDFKTTLDFWHLNRKFSAPPKLNGVFSSTKDNIRNDIFAVRELPDGTLMPNLQVDIFNNIIARRPMYYYENPEL